MNFQQSVEQTNAQKLEGTQTFFKCNPTQGISKR